MLSLKQRRLVGGSLAGILLVIAPYLVELLGSLFVKNPVQNPGNIQLPSPTFNNYNQPTFNNYNQPTFNNYNQPTFNNYNQPTFNNYNQLTFNNYNQLTYSFSNPSTYTPHTALLISLFPPNLPGTKGRELTSFFF
jgi:hypothetical protein